MSTFFSFSTKVNYTITVDSVSSVTINNVNLKRLFVKYARPGMFPPVNTFITERIGCERFTFNYRSPSPNVDGDQALYCLCCNDTEFGLKQFSSLPCNYAVYVGVNEKQYQDAPIHVFPNPSADLIQIKNESGNFSNDAMLKISDLSGRLVKLQLLKALILNELSIAGLNQGVYLLQIIAEGEILFNGKVIKQN